MSVIMAASGLNTLLRGKLLYNLSRYRSITKTSYHTSSRILRLNSVSEFKEADVRGMHIPKLHSHPCIQRCASTIANDVLEPGMLKRLVKKMGWLDHSRSKLKRSGFLLYENISEKVQTMDFFEVCELPDTFFSWFLVTELHVWMIMVRLMAEGDEGRYTRNCLVEALWEDVAMRAKKLGDSSPTARNEQIEEIVSSFQAMLFSYDEGLLSDDKVLASALWRRLFSKSCNDPERVECCVQYVRKQIAHLDSLSRRQFMLECKVEWLPLLEQDLQR